MRENSVSVIEIIRTLRRLGVHLCSINAKGESAGVKEWASRAGFASELSAGKDWRERMRACVCEKKRGREKRREEEREKEQESGRYRVIDTCTGPRDGLRRVAAGGTRREYQ